MNLKARYFFFQGDTLISIMWYAFCFDTLWSCTAVSLFHITQLEFLIFLPWKFSRFKLLELMRLELHLRCDMNVWHRSKVAATVPEFGQLRMFFHGVFFAGTVFYDTISDKTPFFFCVWKDGPISFWRWFLCNCVIESARPFNKFLLSE